MSERAEINPDELPVMKMDISGEEFEATPLNTTLFTFVARISIYNHIFIQTAEEDQTLVGAYVFSLHNGYKEMTEFMARNDYPMVLNRLEVPDCDVSAFNRMIEQQAGDLDEIPDDWN